MNSILFFEIRRASVIEFQSLRLLLLSSSVLGLAIKKDLPTNYSCLYYKLTARQSFFELILTNQLVFLSP